MQLVGDETAPNIWTVIWYDLGSPTWSRFSHRKQRNDCWWDVTSTWWYIFWMSSEMGTGRRLNRKSTPIKLVKRSGLLKSCLLREVLLWRDDGLKTTRNFPGLCEFTTPWCGRYQMDPDEVCWVSSTGFAWLKKYIHLKLWHTTRRNLDRVWNAVRAFMAKSHFLVLGERELRITQH